MAEPSLDAVRSLLENAKTIAVLGATPRSGRAGNYVPEYLVQHGYRVFPVNPAYVGQSLFGEPVRASLTELPEPIDLVDVFRRPDQLPGHVDDFLAMQPRPAVVWFQQGIVHDAVAETLRAEGMIVVQDRCTLADHRRLF